jgi:hypothetical protein
MSLENPNFAEEIDYRRGNYSISSFVMNAISGINSVRKPSEPVMESGLPERPIRTRTRLAPYTVQAPEPIEVFPAIKENYVEGQDRITSAVDEFLEVQDEYYTALKAQYEEPDQTDPLVKQFKQFRKEDKKRAKSKN